MWQFDGKDKNGNYPIKIMVYHNGKRSYKKTGVKVASGQWDDFKKRVKDHPNGAHLNAKLKDVKQKYDAASLKAQVMDKSLVMKNVGKSKTFEELVRELRKDPQDYLDRIVKVCGKLPRIEEVDIYYMRNFEAKQRGLRYGENTIALDSALIRSVMNRAKDYQLVDFTPWDEEGGNYASPHFVDTETVFLTFPERGKLYSRFLSERDQQMKNGDRYFKRYKVLVYFLLGCYTGFRRSDWYNFDIKTRAGDDGFIRLRAQKNKEWVTIEIGEKLQVVLDEIRRIGALDIGKNLIHWHLIGIFKMEGIDKRASTHVARHSFGYACAALGINISACATYLGITVETAETYYHLVGAELKKQSKALAAI